MTPHLVRWQQTYGPRGFTVLYVGDGRRTTASALETRARSEGWNFPIHVDDGTAMAAYEVRAYPTAYIVGRDGRVVWEGIPVFDPVATEEAIVAALR